MANATASIATNTIGRNTTRASTPRLEEPAPVGAAQCAARTHPMAAERVGPPTPSGDGPVDDERRGHRDEATDERGEPHEVASPLTTERERGSERQPGEDCAEPVDTGLLDRNGERPKRSGDHEPADRQSTNDDRRADGDSEGRERAAE